MLSHVLRAVRRRGVGSRLVHAILCAIAVALAALPMSAHAGEAPYGGWRWIRRDRACAAPAKWTAEKLFRSGGLPAYLADLCLYTWKGPYSATSPSRRDVALLQAAATATAFEDVPVVVPMSPTWIPEEESLFAALRAASRDHVGDFSLLPAMPRMPRVRVAVIDTTPDAPAGYIGVGHDRHGDTLAHLIEDMVCDRHPCQDGHCDDGRTELLTCAAEVTTELALPWLGPNERGANGGNVGTLADLAQAIDRALWRWTMDRATSQATPPRLLLNLSVGWEDLPGVADCNTGSPDQLSLGAQAVHGILAHAAASGAIIIAAAGNDSGGPTPRTGLVCPGRFQGMSRQADGRSLLIAASGVDYHDRPLETARPNGITGISGLGLGAVAWSSGSPVPSQLVGSSVATAMVSAVSALVWTQRLSWSASQITDAVYAGGVEGPPAQACPLPMTTCVSRRASVCGALDAAGVAVGCSPKPPQGGGWPDLSAELTALADASAGAQQGAPTELTPFLLSDVPRYLLPTAAAAPWLFPAPISATCPTCRVAQGLTSNQLQLDVPALEFDITNPVLVVRLTNGTLAGLSLGAIAAGHPWRYPIPQTWSIDSAYLTGVAGPLGNPSFTEQILVQP